jgi:four helix bundle protein
MPYQNFEELEVWKKSCELKKEVFVLVKTFPDEEKYNLCSQLLRSARSVPTQISEGHGRRTFPDRLRFCIIA